MHGSQGPGRGALLAFVDFPPAALDFPCSGYDYGFLQPALEFDDELLVDLVQGLQAGVGDV